jgi:hypothetical protein
MKGRQQEGECWPELECTNVSGAWPDVVYTVALTPISVDEPVAHDISPKQLNSKVMPLIAACRHPLEDTER